MTDKPIHSIKDYPLEVAIWQTTTEQDGKKRTFHNITLIRTYKEGEEYKTTQNLNSRDLLNAGHLLTLVHEHIRKLDNPARS